ncbi:MAG: MFS transporter, partial [Ignavibacteriaceae bacterium]|nr:MFS transporter [Ignavibacteriaceae bacterium]
VVLISVGTILPSITARFVIDEITAGSLATLLPFGILVGSIVFGPVVDRYGYKNMLIICSLLVLIGIEGIAYAKEFYVLQAAIFLIGFGGGVLNGGTNSLVADISDEGKGAKLSLLGVFFGIGALGMPALLGALSNYYEYDSILAGVGLFVLLPILYFLFIKFPEAKQPQGLPIKKGIGLIKESSLLLLGLILFFESGLEGIVNNWTTTYLINDLKTKPDNALFALSYFVIGMTVTRLLLGGLLRKLSSYKVLYVSIIIAFGGAIILSIASTYAIAVTGLVLLGIGFAASFPVVLGYVGDIYKQLSGTAFSIALVIALTGNMILNYTTGVIAQTFGIKYFTSVLFLSLILMTVVLFFTLKNISEKTKI